MCVCVCVCVCVCMSDSVFSACTWAVSLYLQVLSIAKRGNI